MSTREIITHPHDAESEALSLDEPIIHEHNRGSIRQTSSNAISDTLRDDQVSGAGRKGAQRKRQAHNHKTYWRGP